MPLSLQTSACKVHTLFALKCAQSQTDGNMAVQAAVTVWMRVWQHWKQRFLYSIHRFFLFLQIYLLVSTFEGLLGMIDIAFFLASIWQEEDDEDEEASSLHVMLHIYLRLKSKLVGALQSELFGVFAWEQSRTPSLTECHSLQLRRTLIHHATTATTMYATDFHWKYDSPVATCCFCRYACMFEWDLWIQKRTAFRSSSVPMMCCWTATLLIEVPSTFCCQART